MYYQGVVGLLLIACCMAQLAEPDHGTDNCVRQCGGDAKTCHYTFVLETYSTMSKACANFPFDNDTELSSKPKDCVVGDGVARQILTVNRSIPAPQIRVCEGDTVRVKVLNQLEDGMGTSIHWHGMHMKERGFMDGVAMITQCPIQPLDSFIYEFKAYPAGTHFYHSHVGMQRGEGIAGALVVLPKQTRDGFNNVVDHPNNTLVIQDWFHASAADQSNPYTGDAHSGKNTADSLIVNGAASIIADKRNESGIIIDSKRIPYRVFNVTANKVYRFRIVNNAVLNCPIEIYVADHTIEVIATDGADIEKKPADAVVVSGGERWDFLLHANQKPGNFWMYFRGIAGCESVPEQTLAIVHYIGTSNNRNSHKLGKLERPASYEVVNPFTGESDITASYSAKYPLTQLRPPQSSSTSYPSWINSNPKRLILDVGLNQLIHSKYHRDQYICDKPQVPNNEKDDLIKTCTSIAQIDGISSKLPPNSLYEQYGDIDEDDFCNAQSLQAAKINCSEKYCHCIHREKFDLGETIELVLVDNSKYYNTANHPLHLHGQYFYVVDTHQTTNHRMTRQEAEALLDKDDLDKKAETAIRKDTIMMPVGGYAVVRFKADNPGPWLFHCHNELHVQLGMFMVVQVGEPPWPKNPVHYRPCGPYPEKKKESAGSAAHNPTASWTMFVLAAVSVVRCIIA